MPNYLQTNLPLLRKAKDLNQSEAATGIGFKRTTYANYESGHTEPNIEAIESIASFFGISAQELLFENLTHVNLNAKSKGGKNVNLNVNPHVNLKPEKAIISNDLRITIAADPGQAFGHKNTPIPITDISVAAGTGHYNSDYVENVDYFGLPSHLVKKNATYLCVKIKGPSMAPTLQDGSYMAIRLLDRSEWAKMRDERIYVVSDREGKSYLKRVKNRLKDGFIVLMSDTPDKATFPNFNLDLEEVNTIWEAEWYLSARMPNIHDQYYTRLQRLEDKVDELIKSPKRIGSK